jgi:hypothetical protein
MWLSELIMQLLGLPVRKARQLARGILLFLFVAMPITFHHVTYDMMQIAAQQAESKATMFMGIIQHSMKLPTSSVQPFPTFQWPGTTSPTTTPTRP